MGVCTIYFRFGVHPLPLLMFRAVHCALWRFAQKYNEQRTKAKTAAANTNEQGELLLRFHATNTQSEQTRKADSIISIIIYLTIIHAFFIIPLYYIIMYRYTHTITCTRCMSSSFAVFIYINICIYREMLYFALFLHTFSYFVQKVRFFYVL